VGDAGVLWHRLQAQSDGLVLDRVYSTGRPPPRCRPVEPPTAPERQALLERIASRVGEQLAQQGRIVRDGENAYRAFDWAESVPMHDFIGHSIICRVATGPRAGQKVLMRQTLPPREEFPSEERLARASGARCMRGFRPEAGNAESASLSCATLRARRSRPNASR